MSLFGESDRIGITNPADLLARKRRLHSVQSGFSFARRRLISWVGAMGRRKAGRWLVAGVGNP